MFPVRADGWLGTAKFHDGNAGSPLFIAFLVADGRADDKHVRPVVYSLLD